MNPRTIALAVLMFAATLAFGGIGESDLGITEDAAASCTYVDEVGCVENAVCKPAAALIEKVTGRPTACIE